MNHNEIIKALESDTEDFVELTQKEHTQLILSMKFKLSMDIDKKHREVAERMWNRLINKVNMKITDE